MNMHHLQTMLVTVPTVANLMQYCAINKSPEIIGYTVATLSWLCHGYADHLDVATSCFAQTYYRAWPKGFTRGQWAFKFKIP